MTVRCSNCQADNRDRAKFCRGCAAPLAAFYEDRAPGADAIPMPRLRTLGQPVKVLMLVLALQFGLFIVWFMWHEARQRATQPALIRQAVAAVLPRASASAVSALPVALTIDTDPAREPLTAAEAAVLAGLAPSTPAPDMAVPAAPAPRAAPARKRSVRAHVLAPNLPEAVNPADNPLAPCLGRNFFMRAICMNNRCAQPAYAHYPRCVEVMRQRRIDEARRNATHAG